MNIRRIIILSLGNDITFTLLFKVKKKNRCETEVKIFIPEMRG